MPKEDMEIYAHTKEACPIEQWEPLYGENGHAAKVAAVMDSFAVPFAAKPGAGPNPLLHCLALYHDMGKASPAFQQYLVDSALRGKGESVNHKTAAARWFYAKDKLLGVAMAYAFEGHHSGLPSGVRLFCDAFERRDVREAVEALPPELRERPDVAVGAPLIAATRKADWLYRFSLFVRMLHSCLVDADWLATECFMAPRAAAERQAIRYDTLETLSLRLEAHIAAREQRAAGRIDALRREIHRACHRAAESAPGVFRLNVPTGGGKTLSSLSFALAHARRHGLKRVIYVIPFTSIIEQTAREFRAVLGDANVLEHQSNIAPQHDTRRNRLSAENWDAPVIVTTSVQFFESLYSSTNRRCRKLHNVARSVIIFDEAQSLPTALLAPCLAAMKGLQSLCGCSLVLCTATQPLLTNHECFDIGWAEGQVASLLGEELERRLAREMKRVEVQELGALDNEGLVRHFLGSGAGSALFIVNLTRQAQDLYQTLQETGVPGLYHLSARMCPAHRLAVLSEVRARQHAGLPTVLVSTRVVEAGVDVSFPLVYRDRCGLDSLAQSAGRCNRHGEALLGQVFSYAAAESDYALPASFVDLRAGVDARQDAVACMPGADLFSPELVQRYFALFYNRRRSTGWDEAGVLPLVTEVPCKSWDFPQMEEAFRLIPGGQVSVFVPYGEQAQALCARMEEAGRFGRMPGREDYRELQQFSVSVYATEWEKLAAESICVHREAGIHMVPADWYDADKGLLREPPEISYVC